MQSNRKRAIKLPNIRKFKLPEVKQTLDQKIKELDSLCKKYVATSSQKQNLNQYKSDFIQQLSKTTLFFQESIPVQDDFKDNQFDQLISKLHQFQNNWLNNYCQSNVDSLSDRIKFMRICSGGYGLTQDTDIQMSRYQQQQKIKNFYCLLSTLEPFKNRINVMPMLSKTLHSSQVNYLDAQLDQIRAFYRDALQYINLSTQPTKLMQSPQSDKKNESKLNTKSSINNFLKRNYTRKQFKSVGIAFKSHQKLKNLVNRSFKKKKIKHLKSQSTQLNLDLKMIDSNEESYLSRSNSKNTKEKKQMDRADERLMKVYSQKMNIHWDLNFNRINLINRQLRK